MRKILCFGDSNTYGHDPEDGSRLEKRWTRIIRELISKDYEIIEEGLCGRTSVFSVAANPDGWEGSSLIKPVVCTHSPIDLLIIMLGTNDLLLGAKAEPQDSADGIEKLIHMARECTDAKIMIISPIHIDKAVCDSELFNPLYGGMIAVEKSKKLAPLYEDIAKNNSCYFLDASAFAAASPKDGVHMDSENHEKLAHTIADKIKEIFE